MTQTEAVPERLNRYLSRTGVGSRRRADQLIVAGRVRLNGKVVEQLATLVRPGEDVVALDGKVMTPPTSGDIWILLNKPAGSLTTRRDVRGRPTIFDHLPGKWRGLIPVGRLDFDTGGAILLTSNGFDANRLMHPRYQIDRVYEASVDGSPAPPELRALTRGIDLGDPTPARAEARLIRQGDQTALVRLVLREGRKREVKRMMEAIGYPVRRLRRVSFAGMTVRGLRPGQWRQLTATEIQRLQALPDRASRTDDSRSGR